MTDQRMDIDSENNNSHIMNINPVSPSPLLSDVKKLNTIHRKFIATTLADLCESSHGSDDDKEIRKVLQQDFEQEFKSKIGLDVLAKEIRNIKDSNKKFKNLENRHLLEMQVFDEQKKSLAEQIQSTPIRSKKNALELLLSELKAPNPPRLNELDQSRKQANLALNNKNKIRSALKLINEPEPAYQEYIETERSESGMLITLKRQKTAVIHDAASEATRVLHPATENKESDASIATKESTTTTSSSSSLDKENVDPSTPITRKQIVQRTCAQAVKKQELYSELIQVKIKTGNILENYIAERIKLDKQEMEMKQRDSQALNMLLQMLLPHFTPLNQNLQSSSS